MVTISEQLNNNLDGVGGGPTVSALIKDLGRDNTHRKDDETQLL